MSHVDPRTSLDIRPESIRPPHRRVLVRIDERTEQIGSIVLPHVARDLPNTGTVVSVGNEARGVHELVGRHVVIEKYAHGDREALWLEGSYGPRYLVCNDEQIVAVLE